MDYLARNNRLDVLEEIRDGITSGGLSSGGGGGITDSTGASFSPDACAHTYTYSSGLLTTDTATVGAATWVKTYTYTSGVLSAESKWVKQ